MEKNRLEAFSDGVHAIAISLYIFVALLWLIPDRRIERTLAQRKS